MEKENTSDLPIRTEPKAWNKERKTNHQGLPRPSSVVFPLSQEKDTLFQITVQANFSCKAKIHRFT